MRIPAILLAAALAAAPLSTAHADIPPPVTIEDGGCPGGYYDVVNVDDTHVCVIAISPDPDVTVSNAPCPDGYTEVGSGAVGKWVCVRL